MMRWVPVKNGWHTEHTSVFSSGSVDPVVNVLPQRQVTTASMWYWGWISVFMALGNARAGTDMSIPRALNNSNVPAHPGGDRPGEVAVLDAGQEVADALVRRAHADAGRQRRKDVEEPVVVDVERTPLHLVDGHRPAGCDRGVDLLGDVGDPWEGEQVEADLAAPFMHQASAGDDIVEVVPDGSVVGPEDGVVEGDRADPHAVEPGVDELLEHVWLAAVGVDVDGRARVEVMNPAGGLDQRVVPGQR